jgi:hypothetical protein
MSKIVDGLTRFTERIVWGIVLVEVLFSAALSSTAFHGPNALEHPRRIRKPRVGPAFAVTFWGVFLITILCGVANITMAAIWTEPTPLQSASFEHFGTTWKMGVGALIGLLGGKTVR